MAVLCPCTAEYGGEALSINLPDKQEAPISDLESPPDPGSERTLIGLAMAYWGSAAISAAARIGVADHLAEQPLTAQQLAQLTATDEAFLLRTLRFLAGAGIFYEDGRGRFHLTPAAEPLRSDSPRSLRAAVMFLTDNMLWQPAAQLVDAVHHGRAIFDDTFGVSLWDKLSADHSAGAVFDSGMASYSRPEEGAFLDTYELDRIGSVVDVGGGRGGLLAEILLRNPQVTGVLCDREPVLEQHLLDRPELAGRWTLAPGDILQFVPAGGDLYILKHVLHNWDDVVCLGILQRCRDAMADGGRLLVLETIAPPPNTSHFILSLDMVMMTVITGRERTREQYEALFSESGLRLTRIMPTATFSSLSIIEAARA